MLFLADLAAAALALYVGFEVYRAWRSLRDRRLSLYSLGMALLAAALVLEALLDIYLGLSRGPARHVAREAALLRAGVDVLLLAALASIAAAVTPAIFYSAALLLGPLDAALAIYIAAVMFVKAAERRTPPFTPLAFVALAASIVLPPPAAPPLRLLTALFLALGVWLGRGAQGLR
ncbi:hypothetical protein [Pyrobaculum neutrophilum]|uniref:Uncharacterized protein n=1 Tax=Pyrobaculum neutrophilum (strain DSM 2338 / JCM 9278 / NBRC 100436 / V24Sta) TaxID=444157 RepID=B1YDL2_PYRNV|nr:hypothetical protein [Pyrobaculum neutrophilum]ACB39875.1 conserved hypothetical protein [Pyrobaculum neutrophilum V24Sta]